MPLPSPTGGRPEAEVAARTGTRSQPLPGPYRSLRGGQRLFVPADPIAQFAKILGPPQDREPCP